MPPPPGSGRGGPSVAFCGFNPDAQSVANATLVYKESSIQQVEWLNTRDGFFTLPVKGGESSSRVCSLASSLFLSLFTPGSYLLTFTLSTRTCGNFDLCSPTEVDLVMNGVTVQRKFATGAATKNRNDLESVSVGSVKFVKKSRSRILQ